MWSQFPAAGTWPRTTAERGSTECKVASIARLVDGQNLGYRQRREISHNRDRTSDDDHVAQRTS
jgi:hypothetical protein